MVLSTRSVYWIQLFCCFFRKFRQKETRQKTTYVFCLVRANGHTHVHTLYTRKRTNSHVRNQYSSTFCLWGTQTHARTQERVCEPSSNRAHSSWGTSTIATFKNVCFREREKQWQDTILGTWCQKKSKIKK